MFGWKIPRPSFTNNSSVTLYASWQIWKKGILLSRGTKATVTPTGGSFEAEGAQIASSTKNIHLKQTETHSRWTLFQLTGVICRRNNSAYRHGYDGLYFSAEVQLSTLL